MTLMYGVWIPKQGWLKNQSGDHVAFELKQVAQETAKRLGHGARVEFIDDALADLEVYFLAVEKEREDNSFVARLKKWRRNAISK